MLILCLLFTSFNSQAIAETNTKNCMEVNYFNENKTKCKFALLQITNALEAKTGIVIYGVDSHQELIKAVQIINILKKHPLIAEQIPGIREISILINPKMTMLDYVFPTKIGIFISSSEDYTSTEEFILSNIHSLADIGKEEWVDLIGGIAEAALNGTIEKVDASSEVQKKTLRIQSELLGIEDKK